MPLLRASYLTLDGLLEVGLDIHSSPQRSLAALVGRNSSSSLHESQRPGWVWGHFNKNTSNQPVPHTLLPPFSARNHDVHAVAQATRDYSLPRPARAAASTHQEIFNKPHACPFFDSAPREPTGEWELGVKLW